VLEPEKGDVWTFGWHNIWWIADDSIKEIHIELYKGEEKVAILGENITQDDIFGIRITKNDTTKYPTGDDYRVKIIDSQESNRIDFSDYFTINTTIDLSKGELMGIYDPYIEWFNATSLTRYIFSYEFSVEQTYNFEIRKDHGYPLLKKELNETSGTIEFTSEKTEKYMVLIETYGFTYSYVNLTYEEKPMIPSYPSPLLMLFSFFGVIILLKKTKTKKISK
jgi:hypothetical protein